MSQCDYVTWLGEVGREGGSIIYVCIYMCSYTHAHVVCVCTYMYVYMDVLMV